VPLHQGGRGGLILALPKAPLLIHRQAVAEAPVETIALGRKYILLDQWRAEGRGDRPVRKACHATPFLAAEAPLRGLRLGKDWVDHQDEPALAGDLSEGAAPSSA